MYSVPGFVSVIVFNVTQCFKINDVEMVTRGKKQRACALCCCVTWRIATGVVAKLQVEIWVNPIFTGERVTVISWMTLLNQSWHVSYFCEGTKDQLDALTNDIKGNANVVRTKLKCELNQPSDIYWLHMSKADVVCCCVTLYHDSLPLKPWSKACPKTM